MEQGHPHRYPKPKALKPLSTILLAVVVLTVGACTTTSPIQTVSARVVSEPPGALVTLVPEEPNSKSRTVIGLTPIEADIPILHENSSRLCVEKRGYLPKTVSITGEGVPVSVQLQPNGEPTTLDTALTSSTSVVVVGPDVEIIHRKFSDEEVSPEDSATAAGVVVNAVQVVLGERVNTKRLVLDEAPKAFIRDARASAALLDPVRLPYLAESPLLETSSGRKAAKEAGRYVGARPLLLITGRSSIETGGMKAGKIGIMAAGTAASFASGYGRALSNGDSMFAYNIYLPANTEGTRLDAVLVDSETGEVLWINRGIYPPLDLDHPEQITAVVSDLLTGLPIAQLNQPNS